MPTPSILLFLVIFVVVFDYDAAADIRGSGLTGGAECSATSSSSSFFAGSVGRRDLGDTSPDFRRIDTRANAAAAAGSAASSRAGQDDESRWAWGGESQLFGFISLG